MEKCDYSPVLRDLPVDFLMINYAVPAAVDLRKTTNKSIKNEGNIKIKKKFSKAIFECSAILLRLRKNNDKKGHYRFPWNEKHEVAGDFFKVK